MTGSCYCLETQRSRVVVDCGLFQEREFAARNWHPSALPPDSFDAMVLTHAHIDHCGRIPRLVREGFAGPIYCTPPTTDLIGVMLRDAAKIQEEDAAYKKKRHQREGRKSRYPDEPLYRAEDVDQTLPRVTAAKYGETVPVTDDISVVFHDAGHILGSAMLQFHVTEAGQTRTIVFSGDIGQWGKPLIRDPSIFRQADYVVMESTYGNRDHAEKDDVESALGQVIQETLPGKLIIPTFAVERAQEVMYFIGALAHQDRIPDIPVFLDSPMAVDVTEIFRQHRNALDDRTWARIATGQPPLRFPGLQMTRSAEQSRQINGVKGPAIIMSTSGMCTAGRIKHHLRQHLGDEQSTVMFVGFQAHGTLGRQILEGRPEVRIHGKMYPVKARIRKLNGFSGHADRKALMRWASYYQSPPRQVFLTHGDEEVSQALAAQLRADLQWNVSVPDYLSTFDLT